MKTAATPITRDNAHWYCPATGEPCYEIIGKTTGRPRPVNIKDAKERGYTPSVTTVVSNVLRARALEAYKIQTAVEAAMTTPWLPGEELDAFVRRIMSEDAMAESDAARKLGSSIHDAIEQALSGMDWDRTLALYVCPVLAEVHGIGRVVATEKIVFGDGYAGRLDLLLDNGGIIYVLDFKTCKKLPTKDSWTDHKLQTAALAKAIGNTGDKPIATGNIYISKTEPGQVVTFLQDDWTETYERGFLPLLRYWQWDNKYTPRYE